MDELENLIKVLVECYADDPSAPSVTLSRVDDRWYASIIRYREPYGEGKYVLTKATGNTLSEAVHCVATIHKTAMGLLDAIRH